MIHSSRIYTVESVTSGHPDKVCDQISDAILDAIMAKDPYGRVACEVATTTGLGYIIMDSWGRADYVALYTGISCMAALGFSLYLILDRLERRICAWTRTH